MNLSRPELQCKLCGGSNGGHFADCLGAIPVATVRKPQPSEPYGATPLPPMVEKFAPKKPEAEYTGGSVSYYRVQVGQPTSADLGPYTAECNDIIEALGMSYAEGNAFKAIWRACAARTLGKSKRGYADGLYDAEKVEFFGGRMVAVAKREKARTA